jgi:hypothetical protein
MTKENACELLHCVSFQQKRLLGKCEWLKRAEVFRLRSFCFVFGTDSLFAEAADQVEGYAEGYDILEKE